MSMDWMITFRSITFAQRGQAALHQVGIETALQRTPRTLTNRGCGYCLLLKGRDVLLAVEILQQGQINYGKVYAKTATGMEERQI